MTAPIPDTPQVRAALALPTAEAARPLGVHPGSVTRLRARLGVPAPAPAKGRPVVVRLSEALYRRLKAEAAARGVTLSVVIRDRLEAKR